MECVLSISVIALIVLTIVVIRLSSRLKTLELDLRLLRRGLFESRIGPFAPPASGPGAATSADAESPAAPAWRVDEAHGLPPQGPPVVATPSSATPVDREVSPSIPDLLARTASARRGEGVPADAPLAEPVGAHASADSGVSRPETLAAKPAAKRGEAIESQFTMRIAVWLGAVAFFLAGVFLVKYTFDAGLLGPKVRIILGACFGVVLLGVGEWLRRRNARIAEGLTAAGVAELYAVTLAALNLYHFIGETTGFVLLAVITAAAIGLSLRQGPFVALLGLLGGFATPALIGSENPQPGPLFVYFILLQGGIALVSRHRRWPALGVLAFAGGLAWIAIWLLTAHTPYDSAWLGAFLLSSLALLLLHSSDPAAVGAQAAPAIRLAGGLLGALALGAVAGSRGYTPIDWGFVGLLGAGAIVLARRDPAHQPLTWIACALSGVLLLLSQSPHESVGGTFGWIALGYGVLYGVGGYAALWGARLAGQFGALSAAGALAALLIAYAVRESPPMGIAWGVHCAAIAAVYALAAWPLLTAGRRVAMGDAPVAALLVSAISCVSLAAFIECQRRLLPVAWAVEVPLLALLFTWLRVDAVRQMARLLLVVAVGALLLPDILRVALGPTPVWNWALYVYGLSVLAMGVTAWLALRLGDERWSREAQAAAAMLLAFLVAVEVRHFFHRDDLFAFAWPLTETASHGCAWLLLALLATLARRGPTQIVADFSARALLVLSLAAAALLVAVQNPWWSESSVGETRVFNLLLPIYGLTAALCFVHSLVQRRFTPPELARAMAVASVVLVFMLVSLEVRQWFRGAILTGSSPVGAELYAYSVAWTLLGLVLLGAGVTTRSLTARWASLVIVLLAAGKVFLVDAASLRDLYRVFSFFGLGIALMLIAFVYQRFVFRKPAAQS